MCSWKYEGKSLSLHVTQILFVICSLRSSGVVHWEDPEESGREGGRRGDRDGEYM